MKKGISINGCYPKSANKYLPISSKEDNYSFQALFCSGGFLFQIKE